MNSPLNDAKVGASRISDTNWARLRVIGKRCRAFRSSFDVRVDAGGRSARNSFAPTRFRSRSSVTWRVSLELN
jgi:hypothetical protein